MKKDKEQQLLELKNYAEEVKREFGVADKPIHILYGNEANLYREQNNLKKSPARFEYKNLEVPIILIYNPSARRAKVHLRHELTHFKQFSENRLVPVPSKKKKDYYANESETEAYLVGREAFSKEERFQKFYYIVDRNFNKWFHQILIALILVIIGIASIF